MSNALDGHVCYRDARDYKMRKARARPTFEIQQPQKVGECLSLCACAKTVREGSI